MCFTGLMGLSYVPQHHLVSAKATLSQTPQCLVSQKTLQPVGGSVLTLNESQCIH